MINLLTISYSFSEKVNDKLFRKEIRVESANRNLTLRDLRLLFRNGFLGSGFKMKVKNKYETRPGFGNTIYVYNLIIDMNIEVE